MENFQMYKLDLEEAEEPEIKLPISVGTGIPGNILFCFTDYTKALTLWVTATCGKFLKKWK